MGLSSPSYPQMFATPTMDQVLVSATANAAFVTPGATGQASLSTGVTGGKQINDIVFIGTGNTVQGVINLWRLNGTTYILYDSLLVPALYASQTTTITSGSNGVAVGSAASINVVSTANFPSSGSLNVATSTGFAIVNYTGIGATQFTGCAATSGSGNLQTNGVVTYNSAPWRYVKTYNNLFLPTSSDSLTVTSTVSNQLVAVTADGATP